MVFDQLLQDLTGGRDAAQVSVTSPAGLVQFKHLWNKWMKKAAPDDVRAHIRREQFLLTLRDADAVATYLRENPL